MKFKIHRKWMIGLLCSSTLLFQSCSKDNDKLNLDIPGLGGDTWAETSIDQWISDTLTTPYNIQVKYRFDRSELDVSKTLIPAKEENVIPVMSMVKDVFLYPYEKEAGQTFIKTLTPKQFVLVGSPSYNSNGSITIGEAEGGKKITLFEINSYDATNRAMIVRICHTIEHEFGHILNQNKIYDPSFKTITASDYTADWTNQSSGFNNRGFITQYAQSNPDDDFVETLAYLLVEGQTAFDNIVSGASTDGATKLREKETAVRKYMKDSWNIDFDALQKDIQDAIDKFSPPASAFDQFGRSLNYNYVDLTAGVYTQSDAFKQAFSSSNINLNASYSLQMDSIHLYNYTDNKIAVIVRFGDGTDFYYANFIYSLSKNAVDNTITLNYVDNQGDSITAWNNNANLIQPYVSSFVNYFSAAYKVNWPTGYSNNSNPKLIQWTKTTDASSYFIGELNKYN